jgi:hypothetical protein
MKCATSTLHEQLARQPGFFMSTPKEPEFFSDDKVYARGLDWYGSLFASAAASDVCGESSTGYTKLPTHPRTVRRMRAHLGANAKLIYVIRHPIDRLVSHYVHEWTRRALSNPLEAAIHSFRPLIDYSCYAMQLEPYLDAFGEDRVLLVFLERLEQQPQVELDRIGVFLGVDRELVWHTDLPRQNVSSERMRVSALRDLIVEAPVLSYIRRRFVPQMVRDRIKSLWMMKRRPELTTAARHELTAVFDQDLGRLGEWLQIELTCENFKAQALAQTPRWT